jgi:hypothetical protein
VQDTKVGAKLLKGFEKQSYFQSSNYNFFEVDEHFNGIDKFYPLYFANFH